MSGLKKGLLIGCGSVLLLGLAGVVAVVFWVRSQGPGWMEAGKAMEDAGAKAGAALADAQCIDGALAEYRKDRGLMGAVNARVWLSGCLGVAQPTADFCAGVPPESEIMASATWRVARCDAHGIGGDSTCPNILAEVQKHCAAQGTPPTAPN
jgi:hypothetical protein